MLQYLSNKKVYISKLLQVIIRVRMLLCQTSMILFVSVCYYATFEFDFALVCFVNNVEPRT